MNTKRLLASGMVLIMLCCSVRGQNRLSSDESGFWIAPYAWMAGIDGDVTVKGTQSSIDADFGDILDNLDYGGQVYLEARQDRWGFFADVTSV